MLKTAKEATDHNNDTVIMGVFYGHAHILNIIVILVNNNINQYNYLFYLWHKEKWDFHLLLSTTGIFCKTKLAFFLQQYLLHAVPCLK